MTQLGSEAAKLAASWEKVDIFGNQPKWASTAEPEQNPVMGKVLRQLCIHAIHVLIHALGGLIQFHAFLAPWMGYPLHFPSSVST